MSDFVNKLLRGVTPSEKEWEAHLIEEHRKTPRMSPDAFAACLNQKGFNSYRWAAESLKALDRPRLVVDLACGDGHLIPCMEKHLPSTCCIIGIDMCEAGFKTGRAVSYSHPVEFRCARANETGLEGGSVDAIICHMGLMLMVPVEPVIREILRVLKPGGLLTAIVSNRFERKAAFKQILDVFETTLHREFPKMAVAKTGDPRTSTREGMIELFGGAAELVSMQDDTFGREVDPQGAWDHVKNMYLIGGLPDAIRDRIREEVLRKLSIGPRPLRFEFALRKFELRKLA